MADGGKTYIAIDLKSFFASVECVERGLDPLTAHLVVADESRTEKTICLAVSPALKAYGISGRARLFEVVQKVREVNRADPSLHLTYTVAPPRMAKYIEYSSRIFDIYLGFIAPEDIHVYSIDEVFIDATEYLRLYRTTAHELTIRIIRKVLAETGITATAGIGTNLYLCKIAMDIVAKKIPADKDGVRIAELDEMSYRRQLWSHRPLTDFWRVGKGTAGKLAQYGITTMGQIARCSEQNEEILYRLFGVNAELLIDHAWGWEPCTIAQIKSYTPSVNSLCSGQVLSSPYTAQMARVVLCEMADNMSLELLDKGLVTDQLILDIGYDTSSLNDAGAMSGVKVATDHYGRKIPESSHGSRSLPSPTSSSGIIDAAAAELFDKTVNPSLKIRRLSLTVNHVVTEKSLAGTPAVIQNDLFTDPDEAERERERRTERECKERKVQQTIIDIKKKFGKNAILKGMNFEEGATTVERNMQIGGHKA